MKLQFIGGPCSGKTTVAAMTFAALKEMGAPAEFVVEQARGYIAWKRFQAKAMKKSFELTDEDQGNMIRRQFDQEEVISFDSPEVAVVCDSSPLNGLLYLSEDGRKDPFILEMVGKIEEAEDRVWFYCPPVELPSVEDHNRVHDRKDQLRIDQELPRLLSDLAPRSWAKVVRLSGSPRERLQAVVKEYGRLKLAK